MKAARCGCRPVITGAARASSGPSTTFFGIDYCPLHAHAPAMREALEKIASWPEGPTVNGSFDEPNAAKIARAVLAPLSPGRVGGQG